jgi:hypothetical protein
VSGRESGREEHSAAAADPHSLEVVPGFERDQAEGWVPELAGEEELRQALERAFGYRGDVLITRKDGSRIEGYVFDRRRGQNLSDSAVRVLPKDGGPKVSICFAEIAGLAFTGRDMAAGKSWENWVRQYWERKAAGEKNISLKPEELE